MDISPEVLSRLIGEAFDCGYFGSNELKWTYLDDLLAVHRVVEDNQYKVYTVEELKDCPDGTIFHHAVKGRCWIISKANGRKCMQFEKSSPVDFSTDEDPWDKPMKLLYDANRESPDKAVTIGMGTA